MSQDPRDIGNAGEGLFRFLAYSWGASFILTADASATDGYLQWSDLPGVRLWVQVKTRLQEKGNSKWCAVDIKPSTLAEWYTNRPLLVVCELRSKRGWWLDTADEWWPWGTCKNHVFHVPFNQPVNSATKNLIRSIAIKKTKYLPPFTTVPYLSSYTSPRHLHKLTDLRAQEILNHAYGQMNSVSVHQRDVVALAVARIIHLQDSLNTPKAFHSYLELVTDRLLSTSMGGRSFTLAALTSLLRPGHIKSIDQAFIPSLMKAAEHAIGQRTFLNPEFGLIVVASLAQHFPFRRDLIGMVEYLAALVASNPQNSTAEVLAHSMAQRIQQNQIQISDLITPHWLTMHVIRPLPEDADVFLMRQETEAAVTRVVEKGPSNVTVDDLRLNDQMVRLKASELLDDWLSHD